MFETLFHIFFAIFIFSGVVLFPIFSWLKKHDSEEETEHQSVLSTTRI